MLPSKQDIEILRTLARKYAGYAALPVQETKRALWRSLNRLDMQKPMVCVDQLPWHELNTDGSLDCHVAHPYWRSVEWQLRMDIYKWENMRADMVLNPYILLPRHIGNTGFGITVNEKTSVTDSRNSVVGHYFLNQISEPEDIEKIKIPQITPHPDLDAATAEAADEIFGGIISCRPQGMMLHLGAWDFISQWVGVENCYIELLDRPEFMHAVMQRVCDGLENMILQGNRYGLFDINTNMTHCSYTFDNRLPGPSCDRANPTSYDGWAFGLAQLFSSVSPAITAEFEVPYMKKLFAYFGSIYYGCCDRLDDRLDIIDRMPNIRKVSCSPWSDREHFAEALPKKYIMSNKPNPAFLAEDTFNEEQVRLDIRRTVDAARRNGVCLELILKDVSTVRYDPARLTRWTEIAAEETLR